MKDTSKLLQEDYDRVSDLIKVTTDVTDKSYEVLLEERDKIRNEMIKLNQIDSDVEIKKIQMKEENKRDIKRNLITLGTFAVTTSISLYAFRKSLKFDETSTLTSTVGKNVVSETVLKMFRK